MKLSAENEADIFDLMPLGLFIVGQKGDIEKMNSSGEAIFKYKTEELLNRAIETLVPDGFKEQHKTYRKKYLESDRQPRMMGRGRYLYGQRKDGSRVPLEVGLQVLNNKTEQKDNLKVLCSVSDISEKYALDEKYRQVADIIEKSPEFVASFNLNGDLLYINPAGRQFLNLPGNDINDITETENQVRDCLFKKGFREHPLIQSVLKNGEWQGEAEVETVNGKTKQVAQFLFLNRDDHNEPVSISMIIRDQTAIKQLKKRKLAYLQVIENLYKDREIMVSNISHEINNPLNIMRGLVHEIDDEHNPKNSDLKTQLNSLLNQLQTASDKLQHMATGIQHNFRLKEVQGNFNECIYDIFYVMVRQKLCGYPLIFEKDYRLDKSLFFDWQRVQELFSILLHIAIEVNKPGDLYIATQMIDETPEQTGLCFKITGNLREESLWGEKDVLSGIEILNIEKKGLYSTKTVTVANALAEKLQAKLSFLQCHNGQFEIKATFRLNNKATGLNVEKNHRRLKDYSVLIVDDEDLNRLIFSRHFQPLVKSIDTARNGLEAIEKYNKNQHDIILMDIRMPVLNGWQAIEAIRNIEVNENYSNSLIIPVSADIDSNAAGLIRRFKTRPLFSKPVDMQSLIDTIIEAEEPVDKS